MALGLKRLDTFSLNQMRIASASIYLTLLVVRVIRDLITCTMLRKFADLIFEGQLTNNASKPSSTVLTQQINQSDIFNL